MYQSVHIGLRMMYDMDYMMMSMYTKYCAPMRTFTLHTSTRLPVKIARTRDVEARTFILEYLRNSEHCVLSDRVPEDEHTYLCTCTILWRRPDDV